MVASAAKYSGTVARIYNSNDKEWQDRCYHHYRVCGEARFAAQFFGHALSKATLHVVSDPHNPRAERLTDGPAVDILRQLFAGAEGQAAMLSAIGTHFTIAGECYLIGRSAKTEDEKNRGVETTDIWEIRPVTEVRSNGSGKNAKWWIRQDGYTNLDLTDEDTVIRLWVPDPQNTTGADSPFRSLLPILDEIEWLTRYVFAQTSSRLAGAGIWPVPEEIDFPDPPDAQQHPERTKADSLMRVMADAMMKSFEDPGNPASKIPTVVTVPGEYVDKMKDSWITFWSELDSEAKGLRQEAIQRFALGMDLPPERILGMAANLGTGGGSSNGVSHWGAWQIDEDTIKMHVEPMLEIVTQSLSVEYLRPAVGPDSLDTVIYDTTSLRLRPDRSKESIELYNLGLISGEVVVRENRFDTADMMKPDERKTWLLVKMATGSATPEMVTAAMRSLGVDLPEGLGDNGMNQARPTPSLDEHPVRELPNPEDSNAAALVAACDALVYRAMERAGNRLRAKGVKPSGVASYEVHTTVPGITQGHATEVLADAWACAEPVIAGTGASPDKVLPVLNAYATSLLVSAQPHSREALVHWMKQ
jgi:hypothetical protein